MNPRGQVGRRGRVPATYGLLRPGLPAMTPAHGRRFPTCACPLDHSATDTRAQPTPSRSSGIGAAAHRGPAAQVTPTPSGWRAGRCTSRPPVLGAAKPFENPSDGAAVAGAIARRQQLQPMEAGLEFRTGKFNRRDTALSRTRPARFRSSVDRPEYPPRPSPSNTTTPRPTRTSTCP